MRLFTSTSPVAATAQRLDSSIPRDIVGDNLLKLHAGAWLTSVGGRSGSELDGGELDHVFVTWHDPRFSFAESATRSKYTIIIKAAIDRSSLAVLQLSRFHACVSARTLACGFCA